MPPLDLDSAWFPFVGAIWTAAYGMAGFLAGYYLNVRRDFRNHKADFRQFLGQWYQEIYHVQENDRPGTYTAYLRREGEFMGHVAKVLNGF